MNMDNVKVVETLLRAAYKARNAASIAKTKQERERLLSLASAWQWSAMEQVALCDGAAVA